MDTKESFSKFCKFITDKEDVVIDLIFSAAKSLSILVELTDDEKLREKLIEMINRNAR
ncbi:MAG: hypothetical protein ACYCTB_10995 [bacterium]